MATSVLKELSQAITISVAIRVHWSVNQQATVSGTCIMGYTNIGYTSFYRSVTLSGTQVRQLTETKHKGLHTSTATHRD